MTSKEAIERLRRMQEQSTDREDQKVLLWARNVALMWDGTIAQAKINEKHLLAVRPDMREDPDLFMYLSAWNACADAILDAKQKTDAYLNRILNIRDNEPLENTYILNAVDFILNQSTAK